MQISNLTIAIKQEGDRPTASCSELGITMSGDNVFSLMWELMDAIDDRVFDFYDSGLLETNDFLEVFAYAKDLGDRSFDGWLQEKRWRRHQDKLEAAFVKAYPKAKEVEFPHMLIPFHDWEDKEWDDAKEVAEQALIDHGPENVYWVGYCQLVLGQKYFMYIKSQRDAWYQEKIDLGLPVLPIKQLKKISKEQGWEAFKPKNFGFY